ncbi:hypothetical protein WG904_17025 [Pedobacter sp. Du54]|uniref:hypothetical protein n=1 Tax=Pedobacter anseongensis TaxID=3133439 RepID=UPI0030B387B0
MKQLIKKLGITFIFFLFSIPLYPCSCAPINLSERVGISDFIATAKIFSVKPDIKDENYHFIEIQLYNLYKGPKIKKLKIYSASMSSCSFFTEENSKWLIFATYNKDKELVFGQCSGAIQLDRKFNVAEYPTLEQRVGESNALKIGVLRVLKNHSIQHTNEANLGFLISKDAIDSLKGFSGKNKDFSIYEYTLNENLSISSIKVLKSFKNAKLSKKHLEVATNTIRITPPKTKMIPQGTKFYLISYFYPEEENNESFISTYDL